MTIFKCKMCGGSFEIANNETVATCEYCGTQQTLPKLNDDRRANLYDRANHFRRNNEFDKAMGIYEQILNEDTTDAEAYWSLVLCRYGIEYVEDPSSHKRVPTVNRAQFTAVFDDDNYKSALQYSDSYQRTVYEEEAKAINEIQKGILAISQNEEPFDVFICYKETDNTGRRTPDSVLANELYHQLTQEGFKVFFSRITLEDKLGSAYEPYIFAALNSAKVMVVLGTKPEYFKAVWVRNEWSRYLSLIKQGQKKILVPAYRDMDPYDLPEEFSHLQAQDMSKLGFMQDLIRGIQKIVQADTPQVSVVKETVVTAGSVNIAPLIKRVFMFLEDGAWNSADEYCEKVLDVDPENALAYLGKLMVDLRVKKQEELKNCTKPFDERNNYKKTVRFGDEKLKAELVGYIEYINTRNENARIKGIYDEAKGIMLTAFTEDSYKKAAGLFEYISDYKDSLNLSKECYEKAENARKNTIYSEASSEMKGEVIYNYESAIQLFETISGWKDADEKIALCKKTIDELRIKEEEERLERERKAEEERLERERKAEEERLERERKAEEERLERERKAKEERLEQERREKLAREKAKRNKKIAIITTPILCAIITFVIVLKVVIIPNGKYNDALALMDAGKYTEAIASFELLDNYKDSVEKITECNTAILNGKYNDALALMDAGNTVEAYEALIALGGYKDSTDKANSIYDEYKLEKLKNAKIGDYVFFGTYEQDNNNSNGKENVEWLVLDVNDGKLLVISKYSLDSKAYHTRLTNVTWENCTLRKWINNDFVNSAFSAEEKAMIPTVIVSADWNPEYSTDPGNATQDQVFLLSVNEVNKYFTSKSARQCRATDYAIARGANVSSSGGNCYWWLRSPGNHQDTAACVDVLCGISDFNYSVTFHSTTVRPAMWIDLGF